jgi:hypothetical protein
MDERRFQDLDHLAWSRFLLNNVLTLSLAHARERDGTMEEYVRVLQTRLQRMWEGLGAQGVEGAVLSVILTLEAMGSRVKSSQISPENSELIVEHLPGSAAIDGLADRFDIALDADAWNDALGIDAELANEQYDILKAIADAAGVEFLRETTSEGDVRLILRAW